MSSRMSYKFPRLSELSEEHNLVLMSISCDSSFERLYAGEKSSFLSWSVLKRATSQLIDAVIIGVTCLIHRSIYQ